MDPSTACAASPSGWAPVGGNCPRCGTWPYKRLRSKGSTRLSLPSPNVFAISRRLPLAVYNRWATDRLPHVLRSRQTAAPPNISEQTIHGYLYGWPQVSQSHSMAPDLALT